MSNISSKQAARLELVKERLKRGIYVSKYKACDFTVFDEDREVGLNFLFLSDLFNTPLLTEGEEYKSRLERGLRLGGNVFLYYNRKDKKKLEIYEYDKLSEFGSYTWDKLLSGLYTIARLSNDALGSLKVTQFVDFIKKLDKYYNDSSLGWMFTKK